MEFNLPLPENLAKDGLLLRQWTNFSQRFHFHASTSSLEDPIAQTTSMLLYAACNEVSTICDALRLLDVDLVKLNKILEIVEDVCMPRFILLFERFRYFTLEREATESLNDFVHILRKQVELCEFGKIKDSLMTSMLPSGMTDENFRQSLQNIDGLSFNNAVSVSSESVGPSKNEPTNSDSLLPGKSSKKTKKSKAADKESYDSSLYMLPLYDSMSDDAAQDDNFVETFVNIKENRTASKKKKKTIATSGAADGTPFLCFMCDNEYAHRKSFRRHIASKHYDCKNFYCKHCKITFAARTDCITHCRGHTSTPSAPVNQLKDMGNTEFICWYCDMTFPDLPEFKQHSESHTAVRVFTCELCQKKNHTIVRMVGHLKGHLNPRHKCEICANCFSKPELLEAHLQVHAAHPVHQCQVCGKSFVTADRLHGHMRSHSTEKRFTCELCGRSFSQKVSFDYHKRWHAGEMPYECDICGKKTRSFGDLRKHKRMHSDRRPYVCEVCGKSFRFISNLNRHRKGHSGKRSFVCDVCGRSFIYGEGLRDHIKAGRCPGRKKEGEMKTPSKGSRTRAPQVLNSQQQLQQQLTEDCNPINYATSYRANEAVFNNFPPHWQYMIRNNGPDPTNSLAMMSSFSSDGSHM